MNVVDKKWPIFVLSLSDQCVRRAEIQRQMNFYGLAFEFFDAVDGRKGIPAHFLPMIDREGTVRRRGYGMLDAEYATALSHQMIYKKIIDENLPGAIVLEDDAILTNRFIDFYNQSLYERASLVQLFHYRVSFWKFFGFESGGISFGRVSENPCCTVGYSISQRAARKIHQKSIPLRGVADWPCDTFRMIDHYITNPRLILHPSESMMASTIGDRSLLLPENYVWGGVYAKGWRRFFSLKSWKRFIKKFFCHYSSINLELTEQEKLTATHLQK